MIKWFKSLFAVAIMCFYPVAGGTTAYAQTVNEADSNDTMEAITDWLLLTSDVSVF